MAFGSNFASVVKPAGATMVESIGLAPEMAGSDELPDPVALLAGLADKGIQGEGASLVMRAYYDCVRMRMERDVCLARSEVTSESSASSLGSGLTSASRSARRRARRRQSRLEVDSLADNQGYCYLGVVKRDCRVAVARDLGPEPTVRELCVGLDANVIDWGVFDVVRLGVVTEALGGSLYHAHRGEEGPSFGDVWRSCAKRFPTLNIAGRAELSDSALDKDPAAGVSLIDRVGSRGFPRDISMTMALQSGLRDYVAPMNGAPVAIVALGTGTRPADGSVEPAQRLRPSSGPALLESGVVRVGVDSYGMQDVELTGQEGLSVGSLRATVNMGRLRVVSAVEFDLTVPGSGSVALVGLSPVSVEKTTPVTVVYLPRVADLNHEPARNFFAPHERAGGEFCRVELAAVGYVGMFYHTPFEVVGAFADGAPVGLEICGLFEVRPTRDNPFIAFGSVWYQVKGLAPTQRVQLELRRWFSGARTDFAKFGDELDAFQSTGTVRHMRHNAIGWDRRSRGQSVDPVVLGFSG